MQCRQIEATNHVYLAGCTELEIGLPVASSKVVIYQPAMAGPYGSNSRCEVGSPKCSFRALFLASITRIFWLRVRNSI